MGGPYRPAAFILGAGASMPYGFPSGPALVDEIISSLRTADNQDQVALLFEPEFDRAHRWEFARALMGSQRTSIDTFLEGNKAFIEIGKRAIAYCLIQDEQPESVLRCERAEQWYKYFFNTFLLKSSPDRFDENKLLVITLNYDRSFEFALASAIKHSYGMSDKDAEQAMKRGVTILHLHGDLGSLFHLDRGSNEQRDFDRSLTPETIRVAQNRIRVVHDDSPDTLASYDAANKALKNYEIACFLGFSYNELTLRRLRMGLPKILWGTTYGLVQNDYPRIASGLGRSLNWQFAGRCLEFVQSAQWFDPSQG